VAISRRECALAAPIRPWPTRRCLPDRGAARWRRRFVCIDPESERRRNRL
jgi:hypothetical protein